MGKFLQFLSVICQQHDKSGVLLFLHFYLPIFLVNIGQELNRSFLCSGLEEDNLYLL